MWLSLYIFSVACLPVPFFCPNTDDPEEAEHERRRKIAAYMKQHKDEEKEAERLLSMDERQRKYNSLKRDFKASSAGMMAAGLSLADRLTFCCCCFLFHVCTAQEVSEEEMEAYRLARVREEDPMAQFMSK